MVGSNSFFVRVLDDGDSCFKNHGRSVGRSVGRSGVTATSKGVPIFLAQSRLETDLHYSLVTN